MLYLFSILVFGSFGIYQSNQKVLPTNVLDESHSFQESFFRNGVSRTSDNISVDLSPSKYVKVYFSSRETGQDFFEIVFDNLTSFESSAFNVGKPTKMLIHGWMADALSSGSYEEELRNTYLSAQDVNVLSVDWSVKADNPLYTMARAAVEPVGTFLAQYVDWLVSEAGVDLTSLHLVGHSLGAQISGVVGEHVTVGSISRISGLDPAGPEFYNSSTSGRLDSSDALFVDVIHTCAPYAGFYDACGHVDFYPNKGEPAQPGCDAPLILTCSHIRSHDLFNESIISWDFQAKECSDWQGFTNGSCDFNTVAVMGEHVDSELRGIFYLHTDKSYPYALGNIFN